MMTLSQLQAWCSTEFDPPRQFAAPFTRNGHVYATDGRALIAVPVEHVQDPPPDVETMPEGDRVDPAMANRIAGTAQSVLAPVADAGARCPIAPIAAGLPDDASVRCDVCGGTGRRSVCDSCHGTGKHFCDHCDHEHKCPDCGGTGQATDTRCMHCAGTGFIDNSIGCIVTSRGIIVQRRYVRRMARLPDCVYAHVGSATDPMAFWFAAGCGLVMPLRIEPTATPAAPDNQKPLA